jgi:hypothetical protein
MSLSADHQPTRRVVLPNGVSVDVLFVQADGAGEPIATTTELHVCPLCASELVTPVAWEEAGRAHWDVTLHCPNCDWVGGGVFDEDAVERFDEQLDRGTEALVHDLQRLMRANMEDQIDRFVAALAADAIWPMDF